jgi:succinate dehydrogenase / fumarate reductase iron-sulfur subunit
MNLTLKIWRQKGPQDKGQIVEYKVTDISEHMSFLEMLDVLNEELVAKEDEPIAFDHDCREGICGMCSLHINGEPHGPDRGVTTCQLHMRMFNDGDTIFIEPFRAKAFPVIKDLVIDRMAFERIQQAGGYISVNTSGNTQDANAIPIRIRVPCCLYLPRFLNMHCYHKARLKRQIALEIWWHKWIRKGLETVPIPEPVK